MKKKKFPELKTAIKDIPKFFRALPVEKEKMPMS